MVHLKKRSCCVFSNQVSYLEGLSEGGGSIILQSVPPCNKHLEAEGGALCTGFFMALDQ